MLGVRSTVRRFGVWNIYNKLLPPALYSGATITVACVRACVRAYMRACDCASFLFLPRRSHPSGFNNKTKSLHFPFPVYCGLCSKDTFNKSGYCCHNLARSFLTSDQNLRCPQQSGTVLPLETARRNPVQASRFLPRFDLLLLPLEPSTPAAAENSEVMYGRPF